MGHPVQEEKHCSLFAPADCGPQEDSPPIRVHYIIATSSLGPAQRPPEMLRRQQAVRSKLSEKITNKNTNTKTMKILQAFTINGNKK